jgi:hypothetical protein
MRREAGAAALGRPRVPDRRHRPACPTRSNEIKVAYPPTSAVLESTGEPGAYAGEAITAMSEPELQRILDHAGLATAPTDLHPLAYRDRHGYVHLPLDAAVALAKAFAAANPRRWSPISTTKRRNSASEATSRASAGITNTYASSRQGWP